MTTIAFRSGVLAADTLISYGSYTNGERAKIAVCGDYHVALAGPAYLRLDLEEWACGGCDRHNVPQVLIDNEKDFCAFLVNAAGELFTFANGRLLPCPFEYTAIGSGTTFALGAMAHGASAAEAVIAAAKHCKNTGGDVHTVSFPLN